jgi:hypothetical protein
MDFVYSTIYELIHSKSVYFELIVKYIGYYDNNGFPYSQNAE